MYLYFYKDGTYSQEDLTNEREFEFGCVDISTHRKGPIFSFVDKLEFNKKDPIDMEMTMNYGSPDIPFDAETSFQSILKMNNPNHAYNAYPLIKQLIACNNFIDGQSQFMDSKIFIDKIHLVSKTGDYIITEETPDKIIDLIFDDLGIKTCMNKVIKPGFCIMMNPRGYWRRIKWNPNNSYADYLNRMRWSRAFICFPEMETAYNCRYKTLRELERVKAVSVKVTYTPIPDKYQLGYFDSLSSPYENEYNATGLTDILRLCLFVPQIIFIEQSLYKMDATIKLNVIEEKRNIELLITEKETKFGVNTGIFNLIERILTITTERRDVKEEWFYEHYTDGDTDPRTQGN